MAAAGNGTIPPEAEITSPDWFEQLDPASSRITVSGYVNARTAYSCRVEVAPGAEPNNAPTSDAPAGDFAEVPSAYCDGHTLHHSPYGGPLGAIDTAQLRARFPAAVQGFDGNENGSSAQTSNGRPNTNPYAFTVRTSDGHEYSVPTRDHAHISPRGNRVVVYDDEGTTAILGPLHINNVVEQPNGE